MLARRHRVELVLLGLVDGDSVEFEGQLEVGLAELREAWENALLKETPSPTNPSPQGGGSSSQPVRGSN
jgi:hypothetical protein